MRAFACLGKRALRGVVVSLLTLHAPGQWTFTPNGVAVGGPPADICTIDLNGDEALDVVLTGGSLVGLRFLVNQTGTLVPSTTVSIGGPARRTLPADLNGDDREDLVVLVGGSATDVFVLWSTAPGVFSSPVTLGTTPLPPGDIAVADVNADARPDVLFSVTGDPRVFAHMNLGFGNFSAALPLVVSARPVTRLATGDLDRDGIEDLVLGHDGPAQIAIRRGLGAAQFDVAVWLFHPVAAGIKTTALALADLQGDGFLDVVGTFWVPNVSGTLVLKHDPLSSTGWLRQMPISRHPCSLAIRDLDGDGALDVALGHHPDEGQGGIRVLRNLGAGWLAAPRDVIGAPGTTALLSAEFRVGGTSDLVAATTNGVLQHLVNRADQGGVDYPGTRDGLDLALGVGTEPTSGPGLEQHLGRANDLLRCRVESFMGIYNGSHPLLALDLVGTAGPVSPALGLWVSMHQSLVLGPLPLLTGGASNAAYLVPPGIGGTTAMLQAVTFSSLALNGVWASSAAHTIRFAL